MSETVSDIGSGISGLFSSGAGDASSYASAAQGAGDVAASGGLADVAAGVGGAASSDGGGLLSTLGNFASNTGTNISNLFSSGGSTPSAAGQITGHAGTDLSGLPAATEASAIGAGAGGGAAAAGNPFGISGGGLQDFLKKNASWLLPALGGGASFLKQTASTLPNQNQLNQIAVQEQEQGGQLLSSLTTGQLPPGQEAVIQQQLGQQIASIRSKYASMGQSGSSGEIAEIQAAQTNASNQRFQETQALTSEGLQLLGGASSGFSNIANEQISTDNELQSAIGDFATAAGLGVSKDKTNV